MRGAWESRPIRYMLPGPKVYLMLDGEQTNNNVDQEVDRHLRGHMAEIYIVENSKCQDEP